ncbi:YrdB family protein [bacterium]|nr:YrdB family protein [bacterium]
MDTLSLAQKRNLTLRALLEMGIVAALGYWGYVTGDTAASSIVFLIVFPVVGFGIWGAIDFHQLGKHAEYFRLGEELVISLLAAYGLYAAEAPALALLLAILTIVYHTLVYTSGERLLKEQ